MKSFIAIKTRARGCLVRIHDLILLFSSHFIFFCLFFLLIRLSDEYFRFMLEAVLLNEGKVSPEEAGPRPDRGICGHISCNGCRAATDRACRRASVPAWEPSIVARDSHPGDRQPAERGNRERTDAGHADADVRLADASRRQSAARRTVPDLRRA